jgi:hypothetical protein
MPIAERIYVPCLFGGQNDSKPHESQGIGAGARFGAAACAFAWSENRSRVLVRFPKSSGTAVYVNKIVAGLLGN